MHYSAACVCVLMYLLHVFTGMHATEHWYAQSITAVCKCRLVSRGRQSSACDIGGCRLARNPAYAGLQTCTPAAGHDKASSWKAPQILLYGRACMFVSPELPQKK